MTTFLLEIVSPDRKVFSEEVDAVSVPTMQGTIEVLAHHTPLFCSILEGEIKVTNNNREYFLAVGGGFMEVARHGVTILVSRAFHADELNESEIKRAQASAHEAIARGVKGEELTAAQAILRRTLVELKVLRRKKFRSSSLLPS